MRQGAVDVVFKDRIFSLPFSVSRALREANYLNQLQKTRKQLRNQKAIMAQNKELKKTNEAKDKFFSIIAHDLKTPLNSLLGFSELLVENTNKKKYEECERIAEIIHHSSILATNLLSNLLSWAQTQIGSIEFHPEHFIFSDLVQQVSNQFIDAALLKNITIQNEMPPDVIICGDKDMLATVLRNIISNAIKFTRPGGNVRISCEQSCNELTVTVSDSGVGIPQNKIRELFQLGSSHTTFGTLKEPGSGLGLILCKEFILQHKGKIWVESSEKGTTFYFSLPQIKFEEFESLKS
jgi:two-component system, sensor histidine kinase and response regulator